MFCKMPDLTSQISSVSHIMMAAKTSVKNVFILRNPTYMHPMIDNAIRWSGEIYMMERLLKMKELFVSASQKEHSTISIDRMQQLLSKVQKSQCMIAEINAFTKKIQARFRTLSACRGYITILLIKLSRSAARSDQKIHGFMMGN